MITCPVCHNEVPAGDYCGACGAHLTTGSGRRLQSFAANPGEHVLQPNVVSTIFPHLPHRDSTPFRLGLLLLGLLLLLLGVLRLTGPAIAVAAVGVPFLYLLYLYEVEVYEDEPLLVIGLTAGLGLLLGIPWGILTGPVITRSLLTDMTDGFSLQNILSAGIVLPLIAQALMLIGPVILYLRGQHREPLDGFTFGVASALGFTLATTVVNLGPELRWGLVGNGPVVTTMLAVLGRGLLIPFLNASTTGLVAGALYLRRMRARRPPLGWSVSLPATIALAAAVRIILGTIDVTVLRTGTVVMIYVTIAAALVLWVRLALHAMLLAEAETTTVGPLGPCAHCHRQVPRMAFCPHCGIATEATPKVGAGRLRPSRISDDQSGTAPSGPFQPAGQDEVAALRPRGRATVRWGAAAGALVVGAVALGITALVLTPSRTAACQVTCAPPPPPCLLTCRHLSSAPPLKTHSTYTSGSYGYSVDYTEFRPSREDDSSIGWDLSTDTGQYSVDVVATNADGRGAQEILEDVVNNNFPDYSRVYDVPGAEVGYTTGAGSVFDDQVMPFFGSASDSRLIVLSAVKRDLAIAVVGTGDTAQSGGGHPDPSGLPVSSFVDSLANATRWPGDPPR